MKEGKLNSTKQVIEH